MTEDGPYIEPFELMTISEKHIDPKWREAIDSFGPYTSNTDGLLGVVTDQRLALAETMDAQSPIYNAPVVFVPNTEHVFLQPIAGSQGATARAEAIHSALTNLKMWTATALLEDNPDHLDIMMLLGEVTRMIIQPAEHHSDAGHLRTTVERYWTSMSSTTDLLTILVEQFIIWVEIQRLRYALQDPDNTDGPRYHALVLPVVSSNFTNPSELQQQGPADIVTIFDTWTIRNLDPTSADLDSCIQSFVLEYGPDGYYSNRVRATWLDGSPQLQTLALTQLAADMPDQIDPANNDRYRNERYFALNLLMTVGSGAIPVFE